jgi:uroporphyrinogen decarboxylase
VVLAYTDLAKEAEAAGCQVKWSDTIVPSISGHVLGGEHKARLARMNIPNVKGDGRLPMFLELCEGIVASGLPAAMGAVVTGPWTVAMLMRGPEELLLDTVDDPPFVHDLMRFCTDYITRLGEAVAATKIGLSLSEPTGSCSLISPDNYREFIKPYHRQMVEHFKARKVGLTVHICGMTHPLYDDLIDAGFSTISIDIDQSADQLKRLVEASRKRAVAIGNVDATIFERATKVQIEAEVKRCIDTAAKESGFILSTSCEIPPMSKPEIVQWFMEAARAYGRYEK